MTNPVGKKARRVRRIDSGGRRPLTKLLLPTLLPLLGAATVLLGVVALGQATRAWLRGRERYLFPFAEIVCQPPPGQERADFLAEVRYLSGLPGQLQLLDEDLAEQLANAFARHPWVETVTQVAVVAPRQVSVQVVYRQPVLAVSLAGEQRGVDRFGIVLPAVAPLEGVPVWQGRVTPLTRPAGQPWGDPQIEAAARTAGYLQPHQGWLGLAGVAMTAAGVVLDTRGGSRICWGQPPGAEAETEASAADKLERLRQYHQRHGALDQPAGPYEHDVRPQEGATCRPLPAACGRGVRLYGSSTSRTS